MSEKINYIPMKIGGKQLCEIFTPEAVADMTDEEKHAYSLAHAMYPSEVRLTSETYSRNADRTSDFELEDLLLVNRKASPEFTWDYLRHDYVVALFQFLNYTYNFKDEDGYIEPVGAEDISITYTDFIGERTINAYMGQTVEGTFVVLDGVLYVQGLRLAFPER